MKNLTIILLTAALGGCSGQAQRLTTGSPLFQVTESGKAGFIDSTGQVVIAPAFMSAGEFSEGLAQVRINGTYGYIDRTGKFVIQPQYDYATAFHEGYAIVYTGGQPYYINSKGDKPFECRYVFITPFEQGRAMVRTASEKCGVLDKHGKLIMDTVYSTIGDFNDGLAIVCGINHHPYEDSRKGITKRQYEVGVIDTLGKFVVPYGRYQDISDYDEGYFKAETMVPTGSNNENDSKTVILDSTGKEINYKEQKPNCYVSGTFHCGLAKMELYKYWIPEEKGVLSTSEKDYGGYMNTKGEITISDTGYEEVEDFSENRAFVQDRQNNYLMINTKGKVIARNIDGILRERGFKNGLAFVEKDFKWGLIDTNGRFVIQPKFTEIDEAGMMDDYFFYKEKDPQSKKDYDMLTGIARKDGSIILRPVMQDFDRAGFIDGLLECVIDHKLTYIDRNGKITWQQQSSAPKQMPNLNIDFMNRGYFYAQEKISQRQHPIPWTKPVVMPPNVSPSEVFPANSLSVRVNTEVRDTFSTRYYGFPVYVVNNTSDRIDFNVQDSRLYMKVQALNAKGEWKDIEYLPSSWCGNSYYTLALEANEYWTFVTPQYEGDFKTKLRLKLDYTDPADTSERQRDKKELSVYSNEFDGSINPGQFWRKQGYYPSGIMDPYND